MNMQLYASKILCKIFNTLNKNNAVVMKERIHI